MTHLHYIVLAATDRVKDQFSDVTNVDVIAESAREALKKAKSLCEEGKRHFHISQILEHHEHTEVK